MNEIFCIAIDGPAGVGKGTLARALANHYHFAYLDTGMLYRRFALKALERGDDGDMDDATANIIARMIATEGVAIEPPPTLHARLTGTEISQTASQLAALPSVRAALLPLQQDFIRQPPAGSGGVVLDGRDIASVICPQAQVKLFLTATPATRAKRRLTQWQQTARPPARKAIEAALHLRDQRDAKRPHAPLARHPQAVLLDSDKLTIKETIARACQIVDKVRAHSAARVAGKSA